MLRGGQRDAAEKGGGMLRRRAEASCREGRRHAAVRAGVILLRGPLVDFQSVRVIVHVYFLSISRNLSQLH